jgi:uncharacterized protein YndB with AHSA1/START domain
MKVNEIRIIIDAPQEKVFEYTLEPKNTQFWVEESIPMETDTKQINVGTKYSNKHITRKVTDYERDKFIELTDIDGIYSCSYSFKKIENNKTELIFFESNSNGSEVEYPIDAGCFKKLKEIIENN